MPTVVYLACFPGAELLDIAGPTSVFSTATSLLRRKAGYEVRLVAVLKTLVGPAMSSSSAPAKHAMCTTWLGMNRQSLVISAIATRRMICSRQ